MKLIKLFFLTAALSPVVSCKVENTATSTRNITQIIGYSESLSSKTQLGSDGKTVNWMPKDSVNIFVAGASTKFVSINEELSSTASFSGDLKIILSGPDVYSRVLLFGAYPYSKDNKQENGTITMTVPAKQKAVVNSYDPAAFPSIACSDETTMYFSNVCGGICFTLSAEGIKTVTISGNTGEVLAGRAEFGFNEAGVVSSFTTLEPETEITLSAPSGECFKTDCRYYLPTLPVELKSGFKITFKKASSQGNKIFSSPVQIFRNQFISYDLIDSEVQFN